MTLTIQIRDDERRGHVYRPGDSITGTLYLKGPIRDQALEVYVTLSGHTQVEIEEYRSGDGPNGCRKRTLTYRNNTRLFIRKQLLFEGQCHLDQNQTRTWDFCLWLPLKIPPSFYFDSTRPRSDGVKAQIHYHLKSSAHESPFLQKDPRIISAFHVEPRRSPRAKSKHDSVAELVNSKGSLWNRTKMFFRRIRRKLPGCKSDPKDYEMESIINLNAILPSTIGLVEAHTVSFEFTNDITTKVPVAAIKILKLRHKVVGETTFRASGTKERRHGDVWRFETKDGLPFIEDGERINIDLSGIGPFETVSFHTASIRRIYWSRTTVKVDFGGERRTVRLDVPILTVLDLASTDEVGE